MNLFFLAAFGAVIGSTLFMLEPHKNKKILLYSVLLGVVGSVIGGIYAHTFFEVDFSNFGVIGYLMIIFVSVLLWFIGKIIRQSK